MLNARQLHPFVRRRRSSYDFRDFTLIVLDQALLNANRDAWSGGYGVGTGLRLDNSAKVASRLGRQRDRQQVAIVGGDARSLLTALHGVSMPGALELAVPDTTYLDASPVLQGKGPIDGNATAYVCIGPQCSLPVTDADAFARLLHEQRVTPV